VQSNAKGQREWLGEGGVKERQMGTGRGWTSVRRLALGSEARIDGNDLVTGGLQPRDDYREDLLDG
jgi:hypothetical protein